MLCADEHPDYRSIARFRKRHLEALGELFVQALRLCKQAKLVGLGSLALDGMKLRANASRHKAMSYERMVKKEQQLEAEIAVLHKNVDALLSEAEQVDAAEEDERFGADRRGDELPEELQRRETRLAKIREAKEALEADARERETARRADLAAEGKTPRSPRDGRDPFAPKPTAQRNFTDPESKIMKTADGSYHQCYNGQAVVDSVAQVIVVAELSDQAADQRQLEPALEQLDENLEAIDAELPDGAVLTADGGYFSEENVKACEQHGVDPFIATGRFKNDEPPPPAPRGPIPTHATPKQRMARDRRAGVRPDRHRPGRPPGTDPRQASRPRPMALRVRDPQPAQAPPRRRPRDPEHLLTSLKGSSPGAGSRPGRCQPGASDQPTTLTPSAITINTIERRRSPTREPIATHAPHMEERLSSEQR
jgi:PAS domain-containing protein